MAILRPFAALRPPRDKAAGVCAVPYDVVSADEAKALAAGNPLSFLHVSRPEIDLPQGTDPFSEAVYLKAAENFQRLRRAAPLTLEETPSLYVYRLRRGDHVQAGVAGCCSVDEYDAGVIRKHERTRQDKEDDRTRHMLALRSQTGPVFMTYRDRPAIDEVVRGAMRGEPLYDVKAPDGVEHALWRMDPGPVRRLTELFAEVPSLYIADGHHRAASASRARARLREQGEKGGEADHVLSVVFPAGQLRILPYNRVVKDLHGMTPRELLSRLSSRFTVTEGADPSPARRGTVSLYLDGAWHGVDLGPAAGRGAAAGDTSGLDVSVLQEEVLSGMLGIRDVRTDKRIDFVGGSRGTAELRRLVDSGRAAAAFSMHPVSLDDLMAVSDAGGVMPPKSTWFDPKLRDGFLCHMI
ncbi:MAG TPA: DUF1015 family protein [Candidatus Polarisedimenticolia bacterium]|nr:DUF1015 family protein [Candidatus Polarisedimenticolia bacterium]